MSTTHKQNPFGALNDNVKQDEKDINNQAKSKKLQDESIIEQSKVDIKEQIKSDNQAQHTQEAKRTIKVIPQIASDNIKEENIRQKDERKIKGVTANPHPQDRHSGTGINPWEKKAKRGGGGKYNIGTINDELRQGEEESMEPLEEEITTEADKAVTLGEYYKQKDNTSIPNAAGSQEMKAMPQQAAERGEKGQIQENVKIPKGGNIEGKNINQQVPQVDLQDDKNFPKLG